VENLFSDLELYQAQAPSLEIASDEQTYLRAMQPVTYGGWELYPNAGKVAPC